VPTIYTMMDISRWALSASTRQLDVVSHNVANVTTPEYSRQEAVQATRSPQYAREGWYGSGVQLTAVVQKADRLIYERITDKISDQAYEEARLYQLRRLEALSNEVGEAGLGEELTAFFSAWQDGSNNPESSAVRQVLAETAQNLVNRLRTLMYDLDQVSRDLDIYLDEAVADVNQTLKRVAALNDQIIKDEAGGKSANDLRDERIRQLNHLAELININWFEGIDGAVTVQTKSGKTLVQQNYPEPDDRDPLYFGEVDGYDRHQLIWRELDVIMDHNEIDGGRIGAYLKVRGENLASGSTAEDKGDVPQMESFLNELAETIIWEVNRLHSQGVGMDLTSSITGTNAAPDPDVNFGDPANTMAFADQIEDGSFDLWVYENGTRRGYTIDVDDNMTLNELVTEINDTINPTADETQNPVAMLVNDSRLRLYAAGGIEFGFANDTSGVLAALGVNTFFQGSTATSMAVNGDVYADVRKIAAGRLTADGEHAVGSNANALLLADLKDADTMGEGDETFNESVISWAADLGTIISSSQDRLDFVEIATEELRDLRDQVSAVNLDEEMVKLIQYQRSYQMAAKMISVADTLMATLLETKR